MELTTKIIGWGLILGGIVLIVWTLSSSYNIFTGQTDLPEFFEMAEEGQITQKGSQDMQAQMEQIIGEQLKAILPAGSLTQLLNLLVWSMLAFILIFGGAQITSLGIKLIRNRVSQ